MNQATLKNNYINRAKTLAAVMTKTKSVRVTISGSTAYRQPGLINLPLGDFTDPEWRKMLDGYIDHELGHEQHTDHQCFVQAAKESASLKHLLNILEDVRMEVCVMNAFRGARTNLTKLVELAIKRELFEDPSTWSDAKPIQVVQALCLYHGRSEIAGQKALSQFAQNAFYLCGSILGQQVTSEIVAKVDLVSQAKSTQDCLDLAREILNLLKQQQQQQQQQDQSQDENEQGDPEGSESDSPQGDNENEQQGDAGTDSDSDDEDDSDGSGSNTAQADDDEQQGDDSGSAGDAEEQPSQGSAPSTSQKGQGNEPTSEEIIEAIERILNSEDEGMDDFHDLLADALSEEAEEAQDENPGLGAGSIDELVPIDTVYQVDTLVDKADARRLSGSIYQTIHKVLFDQVASLAVTRKTGVRIDAHKLSGIPAGNLSVFTRKEQQQDISAALSVVVDASGSMSSLDMTTANTSALGFAMACQKAGVPVEVSYYGVCPPFGTPSEVYGYYTAKRFEEKRVNDAKFGVSSYGSTPTGCALKSAIYSMAMRPESKKFIFLVTDGRPNSVQKVMESVQMAKLLGVKIVPIGLGTTCVGGFSEDEFVTLNSTSELVPALRQAIKMKLFK